MSKPLIARGPDRRRRELLTIAEASDRAHVSRRSIYNWLQHGNLETERTVGGAIRIYADSLWKPKETHE